MKGMKHSQATYAQRKEQSTLKNGFRPGVYESRGLYIGDWVDDKKQGNGKQIYRNNRIYQGQWVANKRHGFGVLVKKVGDHLELVYEGLWSNNRFARGILYEENGIYDGEFSKGCLRNGCLRNGYGTMWWNDGAMYSGQWLDDRFHGIGHLEEVDGKSYDGSWRDGIRHGEGVVVIPDKRLVVSGVWVDGSMKISVMENYECRRRPGAEENDGSVPDDRVTTIPKLSRVDVARILEGYRIDKEKMLLEI